VTSDICQADYVQAECRAGACNANNARAILASAAACHHKVKAATKVKCKVTAGVLVTASDLLNSCLENDL
jgi:hypothetical protein